MSSHDFLLNFVLAGWSALWFLVFIASFQNRCSNSDKPLRFFADFVQSRPHTGLSLSLNSQALTLQEHQIVIISSSSISAQEETDFSACVFAQLQAFLPLTECCIHSGAKACRRRSIPGRDAGRGHSFDKGLLQITFLPSLLPLSVYRFSRSFWFSLFTCLSARLSLSLIVVQLIMV